MTDLYPASDAFMNPIIDLLTNIPLCDSLPSCSLDRYGSVWFGL